MTADKIPDPARMRCAQPGCTYAYYAPCTCCQQLFCLAHLEPAAHNCHGKAADESVMEEEGSYQAPYH